ncbi:MAG: hypothetical protein JWN78_658 [Bacteroidota bacterium]|nr:hypothetical protein [Bacteroidota bacterium]
MPAISVVFAAIAALLHVLFFLMESVYFMNPKVHKGFGVKNLQDAEVLKVSMFNQGYYNLFLAGGIFAGIYYFHSEPVISKALILFCCAYMFLASIVLLISKPGMMRGVLIQGLCPLIAIVSYYVCR